jgi:hypothetical protein
MSDETDTYWATRLAGVLGYLCDDVEHGRTDRLAGSLADAKQVLDDFNREYPGMSP